MAASVIEFVHLAAATVAGLCTTSAWSSAPWDVLGPSCAPAHTHGSLSCPASWASLWTASSNRLKLSAWKSRGSKFRQSFCPTFIADAPTLFVSREDRSRIAFFQSCGWSIGTTLMPLLYWWLRHWDSFMWLTSIPTAMVLLFSK